MIMNALVQLNDIEHLKMLKYMYVGFIVQSCPKVTKVPHKLQKCPIEVTKVPYWGYKSALLRLQKCHIDRGYKSAL